MELTCKQETTSPAVLLHSARPPTRPPDSTFAIKEERNYMGIALASDKKLAVEHFCKSIHRYILLNGPIKVSLALLRSYDTVGVLCSGATRRRR